MNNKEIEILCLSVVGKYLDTNNPFTSNMKNELKKQSDANTIFDQVVKLFYSKCLENGKSKIDFRDKRQTFPRSRKIYSGEF